MLEVRAAFEASLEIDWILQSDSEHRARHYIVGNVRDEALWANRLIPGTPEKVSFDGAVGPWQRTDPVKAEAAARTQLAAVQKILSKPEFAIIDAAFTATKGSRPFDLMWYQVLGVPSIRQMAKNLGKLREYELIYGRGSDAMHVSFPVK